MYISQFGLFCVLFFRAAPGRILPGLNSIHRTVLHKVAVVLLDGAGIVPFPAGMMAYLLPVFVPEKRTHVLDTHPGRLSPPLLRLVVFGLSLLSVGQSERVSILVSLFVGASLGGLGSPELTGLLPFLVCLRVMDMEGTVLVGTDGLSFLIDGLSLASAFLVACVHPVGESVWIVIDAAQNNPLL